MTIKVRLEFLPAHSKISILTCTDVLLPVLRIRDVYLGSEFFLSGSRIQGQKDSGSRVKKIPDPGSKRYGSRVKKIRVKEFKYFLTLKTVSSFLEK